MAAFRRVLLKLSGEALKGDKEHGYQPTALTAAANRIKEAVTIGTQVAVVIGAGNLWRGATGACDGMNRVDADAMGMLGTVMNAIALKSYLERSGLRTLLLGSFEIAGIVRRFNASEADEAFSEGKVVVFAGGTGKPFFTTDTAAVVSALETGCDAVIKATKVNGIYSADPMKFPNATRYSEITFDEALEKKLKVMDSTAFSLCRDNGLSIIVFDFSEEGALVKILNGDTSAGTIVRNQTK
ncbi:MAG: UMP kinase [Victivallaceae bacterium]|nr:UMP kinase [Victivallaceae bacterium]